MLAMEKYYLPIKNRIDVPINIKLKKVKKQKETCGDMMENSLLYQNTTQNDFSALNETISDLFLWTNLMDRKLLTKEIITPPENWDEGSLLLSQRLSSLDLSLNKKYALYNIIENYCKELYDKAIHIMDTMGWAKI